MSTRAKPLPTAGVLDRARRRGAPDLSPGDQAILDQLAAAGDALLRQMPHMAAPHQRAVNGLLDVFGRLLQLIERRRFARAGDGTLADLAGLRRHARRVH